MSKKQVFEKQSRDRVLQSSFPSMPLNKALRIAQALWDNFAGAGAAPHEIALSINMSPTSGPWRELVGASSAYGLTKGTYRSDQITLEDLGRRIVAPTDEGDDRAAMVEAVLKPTIMRQFLQKYDRAKFPQDIVAANVLVGMGLPKDRSAAAVEALKAAGVSVGVIRETKTGLFVALDVPPSLRRPHNAVEASPTTTLEFDEDGSAEVDITPSQPFTTGQAALPTALPPAKNNRVFISHGKNRQIVEQLKSLLVFGKLEPIVSVEREATAIPVPDKVFQDMRACAASLIHVRNEGSRMDGEGKPHVHINENVLIEIGAAIALHQKRVVLLVEKGLQLPSNLQGLYRCEYEGDKLDFESTMKLLKTFNEFPA